MPAQAQPESNSNLPETALIFFSFDNWLDRDYHRLISCTVIQFSAQ
jgi:hypothetical protein